ncbi:hypothetical protein [Streptomyces mirabilis]|uniref:hypothetical protein n=1 Tax=Streptomyces mirabilis TaxID=68239 RepID=UPI00224DBC23|nr:hypothetical protein [Streptomyces mirabilis]MCX4424578.1 hypothetical protein [Streptomyces mirabilis]
MSADRETNHDMTHRDIAFLLADAADEAEIGIAPYQAVVRGGRRRKARRWALAAAAALVIAGSTGTLALAGVTGGDARKVAPAATRPPVGDERYVYEPQRSDLARGTEHGKKWKVVIDVWGAPRNKAEAQGQLDALTGSGLGKPWVNVRDASELIGKSSYFVRLTLDGKTSIKLLGAFEKGDTMAGTDLTSGAMPLDTSGTATSRTDQRLVVGQVATTAQEVTCTWDDGSTTEASRPSPGTGIVGDFEDAIRPADGSRSDWFVCLGPEGRTYRAAAVTK